MKRQALASSRGVRQCIALEDALRTAPFPGPFSRRSLDESGRHLEVAQCGLDVVSEIRDVGRDLRSGDEAEVDRTAVAEAGHIQCHVEQQRSDGHQVLDPRAAEVQREVRSGDIADDQVHRRHAAADPAGRIGPRGEGEQPGWRRLGVSHDLVSGKGFGHLLGALGVGVDRLDPLGRIGDVGRQHDSHRAHLVADRAVGLGAGGHRNLRDKGLVRQLAPVLEVGTQRTGYQRQNDIVDLDVEGTFDRLDAVQGDTRARDSALRRNRAVEANFRGIEVAGRLVVDVANGDLLAHRLLHQSCDAVGRLDPDVDQAVESLQFPPRGLHPHERSVHVDCGRSWLGRDVEENLTDSGTGNAVDDRVVHLRDDRDSAVLETFDEPQLP